MPEPRYRGRFAPSPTGPLHFGSLVTALASYLEARTHGGQWLLRIEDLDPLREPPEATGQILQALEAHGFSPDAPIRYQSRRQTAYQTAVRFLLEQGHAYRCICSRRELQAHGGRHPHHCRTRAEATEPEQPFAIRFRLRDEVCHWQDQLLGAQQHQVRAELDDPVIQRKEGFYAYQLAVVVDDIDQGITHVVRGSDLLHMTAQQLQIYQALGGRPPQWLHIPVVVNEQGQKLSKQTHAPALDNSRATANLIAALKALGQQPPAQLTRATPAQILDWACAHWQRQAIPTDSPTAGML